MTYKFDHKTVSVWSEGSRLAAVVVTPHGAHELRPAILLCHGWGGLKDHLLRAYAETFAADGFVCMAFDYRGWGQSDGRAISSVESPPLTQAGEHTVKVRVIREVVDPIDQVADVRACFAWLLTEAGVDPARVGLWGSSYGGGLTTFVTGTDVRVKALVAQIGGYGHPAQDWYRDLAYKRMADKARGLIDPAVPQGVDGSPGLRGTPDIARQWGFSPLSAAEAIRVPTLFIDAEFEEYNDTGQQGGAAYDIVRRNAIAERTTFPCTHYKLYDEHLIPARQLALDWFQKYL